MNVSDFLLVIHGSLPLAVVIDFLVRLQISTTLYGRNKRFGARFWEGILLLGSNECLIVGCCII